MAQVFLPMIAIDGPGGVGKTSVSRALAERLGYYFFSSGLIYRAMAAHLLAKGWTADDLPPPSALEPFALRVVEGGGIEVNGRPVVVDLHGEEISRAASVIAAAPPIRTIADQVQRETVARLAEEGGFPGVILEGRDIGTVVFPEASHKFFFTANPEIRVERRFLEQQTHGTETTLEAVREGLERRDARDQSREAAPLKPAEDAVVIDTSTLTLAEVVEKILESIASRGGK